MSRELVADLLAWTGREIDAWLAGVDLHADATVAWASDAAVPMSFDLAREFTERCVHHPQLLDALGDHDEHLDASADVVLDTLVWAYPHQYRTPAPAGTTVALRLGARPWTLTRLPPAWELDPIVSPPVIHEPSRRQANEPRLTLATGRVEARPVHHP